MLKKLIVIILVFGMSSLKTTPLRADCAADCAKIIAAADTTIAARDKQIKDQKTAIDDLTNSLASTRSRADDDERALSAWYHNPFLCAGIGILVGGFAIGYLTKK